MTAPGIVPVGRPLSAEDVTDRMGAIAETYSTDGDAQVVVCDGFGVRVTVNHGALVVVDGVGEHRRERTYAKVSAPSRLVVAGDGLLTTEALSWCRAQDVAVVVLRGGDVLLGASPPGRDDARLRRAQALAGIDGSPVGLRIVRDLLTEKLRGQAKVLTTTFADDDTASTVLDLAGGIEVASTIDECRQLEAVAAAAYFATWAGHPATAVGFVARDRHRVPPHWRVYDSRRSAITGASNTNRLAERPLNALLNYVYKLAEIEARFALVRLGLDPGLGILHLDAAGRDSLALDVIEPLRPKVDRFVLDLVSERMFRKSDFTERGDGHTRCAAPLSHELAETLPTWRREVGPVAERVAHLLVGAVVGKVTKTTPLTGDKGRAAAAEVRARKARQGATDLQSEAHGAAWRGEAGRGEAGSGVAGRAAARHGMAPGTLSGGDEASSGVPRLASGSDPETEQLRARAKAARVRAEHAHAEHRAAKPLRRPRAKAPAEAAAAMARCLTCGGPLTRPRHVRCESCWERQGGAQSREARRRRGRSIAMARSELDAWRAEHPHATARPEDFAAIRAGLRDVKLAEIMTALSVSKASASSWRSGRVVPALRHWRALATLAGVEVPAGILGEPRGAEVVTFEKAADLREQALDDYEHEQAAAMGEAPRIVGQAPVSAVAAVR